MQQVVEQPSQSFVDRRDTFYREPGQNGYEGRERRQFSDGREASSFEVRELAEAVDAYKLQHRRRFITFEELHQVMLGLGYSK
jgi:hypothetical protein